MVNNQLLLNILKYRFGFSGVILDWIGSYLMERKQRIANGDIQSDAAELLQGVPQGSILGPILFNLYTSPLGDMLSTQCKFSHFCGMINNLTLVSNQYQMR